MGTDYHARVIIGFEATPDELSLSKLPAYRCPEGDIRKGIDDKFCPKCGGTYTKEPDPEPTLLERYAKAHDRDPVELFDEWHDGYDAEIALRRVCSLDSNLRKDGPMVLGRLLCETESNRSRDNSTTIIDPAEIQAITEELALIKHDLGWDNRPTRVHLVLYVSV